MDVLETTDMNYDFEELCYHYDKALGFGKWRDFLADKAFWPTRIELQSPVIGLSPVTCIQLHKNNHRLNISTNLVIDETKKYEKNQISVCIK